MAGGKKKTEGRHHVLMLREQNCKQAAWMRTDDMLMEQLVPAIGSFIVQALGRFRRVCFANSTVPNIKIDPLVMTEEDFDELEKDTWRSEMEELRRDVERGPES